MIGNFQDGTVAGKIQQLRIRLVVSGPKGRHRVADQRAIEPGPALPFHRDMITDSRSFMRPIPRHEYFRRKTLCNLIGRDVEAGLMPDDEKLVGTR